jgi:hypothetical protein
MTKDEALTMCLEYIETDKHERKYVRHAIKAALEQAEPPPEWEAINNIIAEYGLQAIDFVADWKAAQRKPLTEEDLRKLADKHLFYQPEGYEVSGIYNLARAIEAAHGIKEQS